MNSKLITSLFLALLLFITTSSQANAFVGSSQPNPVPDDSYNNEINLNAGEVDHKIPLQVPPGTDGLAPNLSLEYHSGSTFGNGIFFGLGWSIDVPFIYRDTHSTPADTSDDTYKLAWNGTDYKLIDQGSGNYKTNIQTYLNINHKTGSPNNATGDYWTVQITDGTTYRFGYNSPSEVACSNRSFTLGWALDDITDTHGNNIYYNYVQNPNSNDIGTIYPTTIKYNNDQSRVITFTNASTDSSTLVEGYYGGCLIRYSRNLSSITTSVNSSQVRQYVLSYSNTPARNMLSSITDKGSDGSSLPSTILSYNSEPQNWQTTFSTYINNAPIDTHLDERSGNGLPDFAVVDVNGDGLPDIVKSFQNGGSDTWKVLLNNGSSWSTTWQTWINNAPIDSHLDDGTTTLADVNGDGLPDIVKSYQNGGNDTWKILFNTGSSWSTTWQTWINNAAIDTRIDQLNTRVMDVNGDGLPDIIHTIQNGGNDTWDVYINTGSSWNTTPEVWINNAPIDTHLDERSGNGLPDFAVVDVNGDGLPDIVKSFQNGGNDTWLSNCKRCS